MKWKMACAALMVAAVAACGGKVFVDSPGQGSSQGGAGGAITATTGSNVVSTGDVNPCDSQGCTFSDDGSCVCSYVCSNQGLQVDCQPIPGGLECGCIDNDVTIAKCKQLVDDSACNPVSGCCSKVFFGN